MPIRFACPKCQKKYALKDELAGRKVKCTCGQTLQLPQAKPSSVPAPHAAPSDVPAQSNASSQAPPPLQAQSPSQPQAAPQSPPASSVPLDGPLFDSEPATDDPLGLAAELDNDPGTQEDPFGGVAFDDENAGAAFSAEASRPFSDDDEEEEEEQTFLGAIGAIVIGVLLILGGGAGLYFVFMYATRIRGNVLLLLGGAVLVGALMVCGGIATIFKKGVGAVTGR